ncbi:hypothetical protein H0E87_008584 [Populus deltoides]|uniref:Uncharacterized protein n=1 Tax=Populus deltoides TaxID=3696 RepID=A0A8T2Z1C9_POPDE|nr:hypothetical protein H0E87_008584 [Populus deltoides]
MVAMMGRGIAEQGWRKGPWTPEEDKLLSEYVSLNGEGRWSSVSRCSVLNFNLLLEVQHQQQQQLEAGEMKMVNTIDHVKMHEAQEMYFMYHNLEDQCSPVMTQDVASWADFVVEDYYGLWGGLWNLDDNPQG